MKNSDDGNEIKTGSLNWQNVLNIRSLDVLSRENQKPNKKPNNIYIVKYSCKILLVKNREAETS